MRDYPSLQIDTSGSNGSNPFVAVLHFTVTIGFSTRGIIIP